MTTETYDWDAIVNGLNCACGSSGAAVCGAGGVMTWERGRGEGREGAEGVDVDYAPSGRC